MAEELTTVQWMDKSVNSLYLELPEAIADDVKKRWQAAKEYLAGEDWKEDEWARRLYDNLHHIFHQYSDEWSGYQEQATEKLLTEYESFAKITNQ